MISVPVGKKRISEDQISMQFKATAQKAYELKKKMKCFQFFTIECNACCIVSRVKQINSPGWMHETSAQTWCSGKTWREQVEREVGGGIGMGKTCKLKDVSFQCMTKFTTN